MATWKDKRPEEMTVTDVTDYLDSLDANGKMNLTQMSLWGEEKLKELLAKAKEAKNAEGERFTFVALVLCKSRAVSTPVASPRRPSRRQP